MAVAWVSRSANNKAGAVRMSTAPDCIMDIGDYFTRALREPLASTTM